MPTPEIEREARARGDVVRSRLGPMAGALVGAAIAIELVADRAAAETAALARAAFALHGEAGLRDVLARVAAIAWPVLAAALAGALVVGLAQTRLFVGRPGLVEPPERAAPTTALALLGWAALALLALDLLRASTGLVTPADPLPLGRGAAQLARELGRAFLVGAAALAAIDHLVRARARRGRLDALVGAAARAPRPPVDEPAVEGLLAGVERVLYDDELAVTLGRRDGEIWAFARARGLAARALVDAARRRRLPVRAAPGAALEALVLGAPIAAAARAALRLEAAP